MSLEKRYAIALIIRQPGEESGDEKVLFSQRDPNFHNVLKDVWGLGFSRYLSESDFQTIIGNDTGLKQPVLERIQQDIAENKLDGRCHLKITDYVTQGSDIRVDTGEPGSPDFNLTMVLFEAKLDSPLPASTSAYKEFRFLTASDYIKLRLDEAQKGKQCGLCTNLYLGQEEQREKEKKYINEAIEACIKGETDVFEGLWNQPDIVRYFSELPTNDELTSFMSGKIADLTKNIGKVLIVGGAAGRLGRYTALNNPQLNVSELDISPLMTKAAHLKAQEIGLNNYNELQGDAFNLPFADNSFKLVVSQGFLRHFSKEDANKLFEEMRRIGNQTLVAEANLGGNIVNSLAQNHSFVAQSENMNMPRISLFAHLYFMYNHDGKFKNFVDATVMEASKHDPEIDVLNYLSHLAGESNGTLYYFNI